MPRAFELRDGRDVLATLRWLKVFGSIAVGETSVGSWSYKRAGFLHPRVHVREPGSERDVAVLRMSWSGGGTLESPEGRSYRWRNTKFWRSEWAFEGDAGKPLLAVRPVFSGLKYGAELKVDPEARRLRDLDLLVPLAWYLLVLFSDDAAAASGAVTVTGV